MIQESAFQKVTEVKEDFRFRSAFFDGVLLITVFETYGEVFSDRKVR